jgi:O-succinylbenzoate synthase
MTASDIWYHAYELRPLLPNEDGALRPRAGALLKIEGGVADLHPCPELGELSLEEQLRSLAAGHLTPLTRCALDFARLDAEARRAQRSLFEGLVVPDSHFFIEDFSVLESRASEKRIASAIGEGFERIKIKLDWDLDKHLPRLHRLMRLLEGTKLKLRLDFNESLKLSDWEYFYSSLDPGELDRIDYLEDPSPFDRAAWSRMSEIHKCRLALDRSSTRVLDDLHKQPEWQEETLLADRPNAVSGPLGFDTWILKPSIENSKVALRTAANHMERVVFASRPAHPVGQSWVAWSAARALLEHPLLIDLCDLLSHRHYESHAFSEELGRAGPSFRVPSGTGVGFDHELSLIPWKRLES